MLVDVGEMEIERPKKNTNATTVRHFAGNHSSAKMPWLFKVADAQSAIVGGV